MSYFEDFIEPYIGCWENYNDSFDDFQYNDNKWFTDGKWEFYEHLSTNHLNAIRGYLQREGLAVPSKINKTIDKRTEEMFDDMEGDDDRCPF